MKGTKMFPQCGFSNTCVQIFNQLGAPFEDVNVLEDESSAADAAVRQANVARQAELAVLVAEVAPRRAAWGDADGDGDLDLFVAGRSLPGKYADKADSWIYLNENGKFTQSEAWSSAFMALGATSAAVFAPVDSDHKPDLILACEWGAPKIFINNGTGFVEQSNQYGVDKFTGLWRGIDVGDFNNDGLIDFVATNRGLNSSYFATAEQPLVVYHGDFNQDGVWDFIETEYGENGQLYLKRHLSAIAIAMAIAIVSAICLGLLLMQPDKKTLVEEE